MKFTAQFLLLCCLAAPAIAQKISGKWYGRGEARAGLQYNTYLSELDIVRKGANVSGQLNYYFGKDEYQSKISGIYLPATQTIELKPFTLISFFARDANAPDCVMDGSLTLYVSDGDTMLYGQLNPLNSHRNGCPVINIGLIKERPQRQETIAKAVIQKKETTPPLQETKQNPSPAKHPWLSRQMAILQTIEVDADTILLHLYDNGKIDHDSVTVFYNGNVVIEKQLLGLQPLAMQLALAEGENDVSLFAENLGEIPPNTALCIIYAGTRRYDINLSSSLDANGTIRIIRKKNTTVH